MGPLYLLGLASQQAQWLATRQSTVSQNVANANTPGYHAKDVRPFQEILQRLNVQVSTTRPGHMNLSPMDAASVPNKSAETWDTTSSGNSVALEQELLKAGEINRAYALNTSLVKAFHRMVLASVKGSP